MPELKSVEKGIIASLMFVHEARFTDLNIYGYSTDKFSYHLKNVIKLGLIRKNKKDLYELTDAGKRYVSHIDGLHKILLKQCQTIVLAICIRENEGRKEYLIHKRCKQPMKDYFGFPGGKQQLGETLEEAVLRELEEETGLTGKPVLKHISHSIKKYADEKEFVLDDIAYNFVIEDIKGDLVHTEEGENYWMTYQEFENQEKVLKDSFSILNAISNSELTFEEKFYDYTKK